MNTEALQLRHEELQRRLMMVRESLRQIEEKAQDFHNQEQQLIGAIAVLRDFMQIPPNIEPTVPVQTENK